MTRWKTIYDALQQPAQLPPWATQDHVIRALQELNNDLQCKMLRVERALQLMPGWREAAKRFGCLERYEQIEALVLTRATLTDLLAHRARLDRVIDGGVGDLPRYRAERRWIDTMICRTCDATEVRPYDLSYRAALTEAHVRLGEVCI